MTTSLWRNMCPTCLEKTTLLADYHWLGSPPPINQALVSSGVDIKSTRHWPVSRALEADETSWRTASCGQVCKNEMMNHFSEPRMECRRLSNNWLFWYVLMFKWCFYHVLSSKMVLDLIKQKVILLNTNNDAIKENHSGFTQDKCALQSKWESDQQNYIAW